MIMKNILITLLLILTLTFILPNLRSVSAQAPSAGDFSSWIQETTPKFVGGTVGQIISALLPYIFGYIVLGGYQVLMSQGDPKQMAAGRGKITYAVVGLIIVITSYLIVQLVGRILNIQPIMNIFG